jgi:DnaJ-class molecular chaperone
MPHRTTRSDRCKINSFLLKLKTCLSGTAQQAFAGSDADARQHGWQITVTHGGFGRRYRDPRFDYLVPCIACNGRGSSPRDSACLACGGTGRVILNPATLSRPRRGQP